MSTLPNQKGNTLRGHFDKFNGSNDISVWSYHMNALLRGYGLYDYVAGEVPRPRAWTIKELEARVNDVTADKTLDDKTRRARIDTLEDDFDKKQKRLQDWRQMDARATAAIQDNCTDQIFTKINLTATSKEIWNTIIEKYTGKG